MGYLQCSARMDQFSDVRFGSVVQFLLDYSHHIILLHAVSRAAWIYSGFWKLWRQVMPKKSETSADESVGIVEENKEMSGVPAQVAIGDLHEA